MSFKPLFALSLAADPERLHFAAHSHHLWPDASFAGQREAWEDAGPWLTGAGLLVLVAAVVLLGRSLSRAGRRP